MINILRALCERLRLADRRIKDLTTFDLTGRLVQVLERFVQKGGEPARDEWLLPQQIPHHELATMVGASRAAVAKAFAILRKRGVIKRQGKRFLLCRGHRYAEK